MKKILRLTESDLIKLIQNIVNEQQYGTTPTTSGTSRYKYTKSNPLKIPKDPYIYAYEGSNDKDFLSTPLLFVKNIKRGDREWIDIDKTRFTGGDAKKFYYAICDMYGHLLGMDCENSSHAEHGKRLPKYKGPHN